MIRPFYEAFSLMVVNAVAVFVLPSGKNASAKAGASGIVKGAEILVSYGKGFWSKRREEDEATV